MFPLRKSGRSNLQPLLSGAARGANHDDVGASGLFFQRVTRADLPCAQDSWTPTLQYWHKELFCVFPFKSHFKGSPSGSLCAARGKRAALGSVFHRETQERQRGQDLCLVLGWGRAPGIEH